MLKTEGDSVCIYDFHHDKLHAIMKFENDEILWILTIKKTKRQNEGAKRSTEEEEEKVSANRYSDTHILIH